MRTESLDKIKQLMEAALHLRGISGPDAEVLIEDFLGAQLSEKFTHGLGKFLLLDAALNERVGRPKVERTTGAVALVNGNRELGQLAARFCIDLLANRVADHGVAVVGLYNASRYSRLSTYGDLIAKRGLIGLVMNNAGPPAVAPAGGIDPIFGTNPICFAFPSADGPITLDFATSEHVWGEIRQAMLEGRDLPPNAFLDKEGNFTRDPAQVEAVIAFGGHKGYALCMAIELLSGALVGGKMGTEVSNQYDLGFLFLAIDPAAFGVADELPRAVSALLSTVRKSRRAESGVAPRIPGDYSRQRRADWERRGQVLIDDETLDRLRQMSSSLSGGLEVNEKTD